MRTIVGFISMGVLLVSCSSQSENYLIEADELCKCMSESGYDLNDKADVKMNIGVCLLDVKVDLKDPEMAAQLKKKCPEITEGFEEFVDDM